MDAELDRRLAILAGYTWECPPGSSLHWWFSPERRNMGHYPPPYSDSIDAQHCDLDPLVEAKRFGRWDELIQDFGTGGVRVTFGEITFDGWNNTRFATGDGPTRAHARAAACEAALGETS